MSAAHQCKQEGKIAAHGEQIKGICEKLDDFKKDIKADIYQISQKLDDRPNWRLVAILSSALGTCGTIIVAFIKIVYFK